MVHLGCRAFVRENDTLWFSNFNFNGLFKMDLKSGKIEFVHRFESFSSNMQAAHGQVYLVENELVFIPLLSEKIVIYNKVTGIENTLDLPCQNDTKKQYRGVFQSESKIYLFPSKGVGEVLCLDVANKKIEESVELSNILALFTKGKDVDLRVHCCNDTLLLSIRGKHEVCQIDINTLENQHFECSVDDIFQVAFDGNEYWILLEHSQDVYGWNREKNTYIKYISSETEWMGAMVIPYSEIVFFEADIFLINYYAAKVKRIHKENENVETAFDYPSDFRLIEALPYGAVFSGAEVYESKLCLIPQRGSHILFYDFKNQTVEGSEFAIEQNDTLRMDEVVGDAAKMEIIGETEEVYTLQNYIRIIKTLNKCEQTKDDMEVNIYRELK